MHDRGPIARIREWTARRALARVRRITHRMPARLREVERARVLVVAPHMDDEVAAPGGTLALHQRAGSELGVLFCSDSGAGAGTPELREGEARKAAAQLGLEILGFLGHPDGKLSLHEAALAGDIAEHLASWQPSQVFCPFPTDHHRDHQAAAAAVAGAIEQCRWRGEVWAFEVWSTLWPNTYVDISEVADRKRELIRIHASQIEEVDYVEGILGLNRFRGMCAYVPYAEAFYVSPAMRFVETAQVLHTI